MQTVAFEFSSVAFAFDLNVNNDRCRPWNVGVCSVSVCVEWNNWERFDRHQCSWQGKEFLLIFNWVSALNVWLSVAFVEIFHQRVRDGVVYTARNWQSNWQRNCHQPPLERRRYTSSFEVTVSMLMSKPWQPATRRSKKSTVPWHTQLVARHIQREGGDVRAKQTIICINNLFWGCKHKRDRQTRAHTSTERQRANRHHHDVECRSAKMPRAHFIFRTHSTTSKIIYGKCSIAANAHRLGYFIRPRERNERRDVRTCIVDVCGSRSHWCRYHIMWVPLLGAIQM